MRWEKNNSTALFFESSCRVFCVRALTRFSSLDFSLKNRPTTPPPLFSLEGKTRKFVCAFHDLELNIIIHAFSLSVLFFRVYYYGEEERLKAPYRTHDGWEGGKKVFSLSYLFCQSTDTWALFITIQSVG